jgi:hypothetical protein
VLYQYNAAFIKKLCINGETMKKLFVAGCLLLGMHSMAQACNFQTSDSEYTRNVIRKNGGYPIADDKCALINKNNLRLQVTTDAAVIAGVSVAWAVVRLMGQSGRVSSELGSSTYVNSQIADTNKADELLVLAIKDAINSLNFPKAIQQVK